MPYEEKPSVFHRRLGDLGGASDEPGLAATRRTAAVGGRRSGIYANRARAFHSHADPFADAW